MSKSSKTLAMSESVLGVHLDEAGLVWTARADQSPVRTSLTVAEFVNHAPLFGTVRVLGSPRHCSLLCRLHQAALQSGNNFKLEVASPHLVSPQATLSQTVLAVTNSPRTPPSLGGWHAFTDLDMASYSLRLICQRGGEQDAWLLAVLRTHPAWRLVQFIPTLDPLSFARWLAEVLDPRWYVSEHSPDSTSRLEQFLGLRPDVQRRLLRGGRTNNATLRCQLTRKCWLPSDVSLTGQLDIEDPRNFLFRVLGSQMHRDAAVGLVRASQTFTRYVRAVWLNAMSTGTNHEGELFSPEQFFKTETEQVAFMQFMTTQAVQ